MSTWQKSVVSVVSVFALALPWSARAQDCNPVPLAAFSARLTATLGAYQNMDDLAFNKGWAEARATVECLSEPLTSEVAGDFHLVDSLHEYMGNNQEGTLQSFQALVACQPKYVLSKDIAPPGNLLRLWFDAARLRAPSAEVTVARSRWARLFVDGIESNTRPSERPAVIQWVALTNSAVVWSGLVPTGATVPGNVIAIITGDPPRAFRPPEASVPVAVETSPSVPALTGPSTDPPGNTGSLTRLTGGEDPSPGNTLVVDSPALAPRSLAARPLFWGTAGTALISGVLWTVALADRSAWEASWRDCSENADCGPEPDTFVADRQRQEGRIRSLGYGAQAASSVALGLGALLVVTW